MRSDNALLALTCIAAGQKHMTPGFNSPLAHAMQTASGLGYASQVGGRSSLMCRYMCQASGLELVPGDAGLIRSGWPRPNCQQGAGAQVLHFVGGQGRSSDTLRLTSRQASSLATWPADAMALHFGDNAQGRRV